MCVVKHKSSSIPNACLYSPIQPNVLDTHIESITHYLLPLLLHTAPTHRPINCPKPDPTSGWRKLKLVDAASVLQIPNIFLQRAFAYAPQTSGASASSDCLCTALLPLMCVSAMPLFSQSMIHWNMASSFASRAVPVFIAVISVRSVSSPCSCHG